jgi:hypothetical protein
MSNVPEKPKWFDFTDYDGDEIDASVAHNSTLGCWCVYINTGESYDKARSTMVQGVKVLLPQEVGVALPFAAAKRLRDYLTAALLDIERRTMAEETNNKTTATSNPPTALDAK